LAFISAYLAGGLLGHRYVDLYGPTGINVKAIVKAARDNADLVRGIKAHAEPGGYSRWGMAALKLAKEASREVQLPVYIHLGTLWPELQGAKVDAAKIIDEVVPLLDPGDILAHPFTRFPSGFVAPERDPSADVRSLGEGRAHRCRTRRPFQLYHRPSGDRCRHPAVYDRRRSARLQCAHRRWRPRLSRDVHRRGRRFDRR
jgi:predicted amidohydrolase